VRPGTGEATASRAGGSSRGIGPVREANRSARSSTSSAWSVRRRAVYAWATPAHDRSRAWSAPGARSPCGCSSPSSTRRTTSEQCSTVGTASRSPASTPRSRGCPLHDVQQFVHEAPPRTVEHSAPPGYRGTTGKFGPRGGHRVTPPWYRYGPSQTVNRTLRASSMPEDSATGWVMRQLPFQCSSEAAQTPASGSCTRDQQSCCFPL
jgi:hypothetical protein